VVAGGDDLGLSSISTIDSLSRCVFALFRVIRVIRGSKVFSPFSNLRRENLVRIVEGSKTYEDPDEFASLIATH